MEKVNWSFLGYALGTIATAAVQAADECSRLGASSSDALLAGFMAASTRAQDLAEELRSGGLTITSNDAGAADEQGLPVAAGRSSAGSRPGGGGGPTAAEAHGYPNPGEWPGESPSQLGPSSSLALRQTDADRSRQRAAHAERQRLAKLRKPQSRRYIRRRR